MTERRRSLVGEARGVLGVRRLVFAIHDASFPGDADTDLGHGSPYGRAGLALLATVAQLGFDVLQLGPQGELSPGNTSPYEGAAFSRRALSADVAGLAEDEWGGLLPRAAIEEAAARRPAEGARRVPYEFAQPAQHELLRRAARALLAGGAGGARAELDAELARFRSRNERWLARDALFECLQREHPTTSWTGWGDPDARLLHPEPGERDDFARRRTTLERKHRETIAEHAATQFLLHEQHRRFRSALADHGMRVYGDLQVAAAARDAWAWRPLLLQGYRLGAPPSRTNPEGQPWSFSLFDPSQFGDPERPGPVLELLAERMRKTFDEYDGLRIDHPHGLVCPWVYRSDDPDSFHAVRHGARLFAAPDLPDHPALARYAIARRDQLADDPGVTRWDDRWVTGLDPSQVDRYALLFDALVEGARSHGGGPDALACEVLSTLPYPLGRVLARHGLGRFRVTQKLDPGDPDDPYRLEHAVPEDWVMIGTHDTPPLWRLLEAWDAERVAARAHYAAERLVPAPEGRSAFAEALQRDRGLLAQAMLAELFASAADNVMVFFADLFGMETSYNEPGTVSTENWSLRLPPTWHEEHLARLRRHRALNVPLALALALRARGLRPDLQAALGAEAARLAPSPPGWPGAA